jgi:hypothetical protein
MNGTELIVRHSFAPNRLRYCGQNDLSQSVPLFLSSYSLEAEKFLQFELQSFKGLYSYLFLIARGNNSNPFDEKVAEAYWIGNELLENVSRKSVQQLFLERFSGEDFWGKELAEELAGNLPAHFSCHHSFHVFFAHFFTGSVPVSLETMDSCRIGTGKVLETRPHELLIEFEPLRFENKKLFLGKPEQKEIEKSFPDSLETGDWVSFHWNTYCMKLSAHQRKNLGFFTEQNIAAVNSLRQ